MPEINVDLTMLARRSRPSRPSNVRPTRREQDRAAELYAAMLLSLSFGQKIEPLRAAGCLPFRFGSIHIQACFRTELHEEKPVTNEAEPAVTLLATVCHRMPSRFRYVTHFGLWLTLLLSTSGFFATLFWSTRVCNQGAFR